MPNKPKAKKQKSADSKRKTAQQQDLEQKLEEGLEESFPGSDPVAVCEPSSDHEPGRRKTR